MKSLITTFKILAFYAILIVLNPSSITAQVTTADFLNIGVHARAMAFGNSFAGVCNNTAAFYWNPAGLVLTKEITLSGMYAPQFGNWLTTLASYHHLGITIPLQNASIAMNWLCLQIDNIPTYPSLDEGSFWDRFYQPTLRPDGQPTGYFTDREDALFFSFSKLMSFKWELGWQYHPLSINAPLGISIKSIHQKIGTNQSNGIGVDFGGLIQFSLNDFFQRLNSGSLQFGMLIQDVFHTNITWNTRHVNTRLRKFIFSTGYFYQYNPNLSFCTAVSSTKEWGFECECWTKLCLRMGFQHRTICFGAGLKHKSWIVDYLFQQHELGNCHRLSTDIEIKH